MIELAMNLLAIVIVLGLCWGAMMWMSANARGHGSATTTEVDGVGDLSVPRPATDPCTACAGYGASSQDGRLAACSVCHGTGVLA